MSMPSAVSFCVFECLFSCGIGINFIDRNIRLACSSALQLQTMAAIIIIIKITFQNNQISQRNIKMATNAIAMHTNQYVHSAPPIRQRQCGGHTSKAVCFPASNTICRTSASASSPSTRVVPFDDGQSRNCAEHRGPNHRAMASRGSARNR